MLIGQKQISTMSIFLTLVISFFSISFSMLIIIIEIVMIDVRVNCLVVKTEEAAKKKDTSQKNYLKIKIQEWNMIKIQELPKNTNTRKQCCWAHREKVCNFWNRQSWPWKFSSSAKWSFKSDIGFSRGIRYAKSLYFIDSNILQISHIDIDIDINIFKKVLIDIDININILKKIHLFWYQHQYFHFSTYI